MESYLAPKSKPTSSYFYVCGRNAAALGRKAKNTNQALDPPPMAQRQHLVVVAFPALSHINPSRALAQRLARATGAQVTLSTAVSTHRLMFPSLAAADEEVHDDGGGVSYVPYSDGSDHGFNLFAAGADEAWKQAETSARVGRDTFSAVLDRLAARGRPATCVVYAMLVWWAADVSRERGIPRVLCWIQPATMLAVYYRYFNGYERVVTEHAGEPGFAVAMPGLPPMTIRDLPSFFTDLSDGRIAAAFDSIRKTFQQLELDIESSSGSTGVKPMVLVNTVEELEAGALASIPELDMFPVGPAVVSLVVDSEGDGDGDGDSRSGTTVVRDLHQNDEQAYMQWLDTKPAKSVVYVSFGSMAMLSKRQKEEIQQGLAAAGRPFLWVVRKNNRGDGDPVINGGELAEQGMVVEWCDQVRVLKHQAVGCFVTHCGWNSTLESVACGTPVVASPQWSDQDTNARLVVEWGVGVRAAAAGDRVLEGDELARCLETVMGDAEAGAAIRRSSAAWKTKVQAAMAQGGSSERNFKTFLQQTANIP